MRVYTDYLERPESTSKLLMPSTKISILVLVLSLYSMFQPRKTSIFVRIFHTEFPTSAAAGQWGLHSAFADKMVLPFGIRGHAQDPRVPSCY
jgi:hypothetical protein